ncbi:ATP-binding protein [Paludibacterium purpuratum]|uniref:histidine kinase n=1 Tax=Paludibacterium purpuratum TaxID=1144873 RepID=A0A4R7B2E3_9NEIS|nr:ATP-binding protein [Paludibacterium purpuratum]TDR73928.1 signal transduction histidine kinase [Paludibacterium purpuratum]
MKILPRTLTGQLLLAVVLSLILALIVGAWLLLADREHFSDRMRDQNAAERLGGIVSMLERSPADDRQRLLRVLNEPGNFFSFAEPWHPPAHQALDDQAFADALRDALGASRSVQVRPPELRPRMPPGTPQAQGTEHGSMAMPFLVVQVRMSDGTVLTWRHAVPPAPRNWPANTLLLLGVLALTVALMASWLVRRLTQPLAALADAATGLVGNLDQPPLPESGPHEVARAAMAFNRMQRDLRSYLETRSQALAGVSHDLRLPITRLRLRLEQIADTALRERFETDLSEMDAMIGHTLAFLRAGQISESQVKLNLDALLDGLVEDFTALGMNVSLTGSAGRPVLARPQALRRCLGNLMENARRYAGDAAELRVEANTERVTIWVEDRGPGIPAEARDRVFEPYFRLESSRARATGGTGLGLAIARATARAMGGDLTLDDRKGGGLSVRLTFPG